MRGAVVRAWSETGPYAFHEGCLLHSRASGWVYGAGVQGHTSPWSIQIEAARPSSTRDAGAVVYRWYRATHGKWVGVLDGLHSCTQVEFVRRLRDGMPPPEGGQHEGRRDV